MVTFLSGQSEPEQPQLCVHSQLPNISLPKVWCFTVFNLKWAHTDFWNSSFRLLSSLCNSALQLPAASALLNSALHLFTLVRSLCLPRDLLPCSMARHVHQAESQGDFRATFSQASQPHTTCCPKSENSSFIYFVQFSSCSRFISVPISPLWPEVGVSETAL